MVVLYAPMETGQVVGASGTTYRVLQGRVKVYEGDVEELVARGYSQAQETDASRGPKGDKGDPGPRGNKGNPGADAKQTRAGVVVIGNGKTKVVAFESEMPNDDYQVFLQPKSAVSVGYFPSNMTVKGFTLHVASSVADEAFAYLAVQA